MRHLASIAVSTALLGSCLAPEAADAACDTQGLASGTEVVELTLTGGTVCLEMLRADAPTNVDNFLYYVSRGDYDGSLFHRHLPDFILQGGDQRRDGIGGFEAIPARDVDGIPGTDPVLNEPCTRNTPGPINPGILVCSERGNERGTVAPAKLGNQPNSASNNFFFNFSDNRENLDNQNGGFTVFARVLGDGMTYLDSLATTRAYQRQAISSQLEAFAAVALLSQPGLGNYQGCFDPYANVSESRTLQLPFIIPKPDPRTGIPPFLLPTTCGAVPELDPGNFVPSPCSGQITTEDQLGLGYDLEAEGLLSPQTFFRHSCAAVDQFLAAVEAARNDASYQAAYEAEVVYIESATLSVVPEPALRAMAWVACAALLALRRRRANRFV